MAPVDHERFAGRRLIPISGLAGLFGLAATMVSFFIAPAHAFHAWLVAFAFAVSLSLGALLFLMIVHAAGSGWPVAVRRLTEAVTGVFPLLLIGFIPIVAGAAQLYVWVEPPADLDPHVRHLIEHKRPYLNLPFFVGRGVFYFVVWIFVALMLRRWSFLGDHESAAAVARARAFSAAMLPVVGLTLTFAVFDWVMSLQPAWFSTVFGIYCFAGGFVASLGLMVLLVQGARATSSLGSSLTRFHFHALGRLLFAFSVFWAYIAFFQAMLIQIADKPEEVEFYVSRIEHGWNVVLAIVVLGRFILPFFVLLSRASKMNPRVLVPLSAVSVLVHYIDIYWLVIPMVQDHGPWPSWIDIAAAVGLSGTAVSFSAWRLRGRALLPIGDPRLEEALAYRSPL